MLSHWVDEANKVDTVNRSPMRRTLMVAASGSAISFFALLVFAWFGGGLVAYCEFEQHIALRCGSNLMTEKEQAATIAKCDDLLNQVAGLTAARLLMEFSVNALVFGAVFALGTDYVYQLSKEATRPLEEIKP